VGNDDSPHPPDLRAVLRQLASSDERSTDAFVSALYDELRSMARLHLRRERPEHTLGATALVHEAYLRMAGRDGLDELSRTRFFGLASATMRRVLVDHARAKKRLKRGGAAEIVSYEDMDSFLSDEEADELVALDDALARLAAVNSRGSSVVQHRFFGGLTMEEIAELLDVSVKTVQRDWLAARAWLRKEVAHELGLLDAQS
jgi:RNA polymerase sigma factor (TIGR02999 family)